MLPDLFALPDCALFSKEGIHFLFNGALALIFYIFILNMHNSFYLDQSFSSDRVEIRTEAAGVLVLLH